jgi:protein O-GlcNAcase / histone acetyltransferase
MSSSDTSSVSNSEDNRFLLGLVEGFYGRPFTSEQRKDLFKKLKKCHHQLYVYAPKDDYKHRASWRDLYTVEEGENLQSLISSAKASGIDFYYALVRIDVLDCHFMLLTFQLKLCISYFTCSRLVLT